MKIKEVIFYHQAALTEKYGKQLLPSQRKALDAMLACRHNCGKFFTHCSHCGDQASIPLSCGHRSCPQCQNHLGKLWLERQKQKLLPVNYFMLTFTVPSQLRDLMWQHQTIMYDLLFKAAIEAIKTFGRNNHGIELAATGVLHTHRRDKGYHPHVHFIVPGGGLVKDKSGTSWKEVEEKFLINEFVLANIFRAIFKKMLFKLEATQTLENQFSIPNMPNKWVAHIKSVGRGEKALNYLSRYLYRGVISENDILTDVDQKVTFRYRESKTNITKTLSLPPEDFLWRLLRHVLPRGFRRVRDYGFLHANAKRILTRVQLLLKVKLPEKAPEKKGLDCRVCGKNTDIILVVTQKTPMIFRFYQLPEIYPVDSTRPG